MEIVWIILILALCTVGIRFLIQEVTLILNTKWCSLDCVLAFINAGFLIAWVLYNTSNVRPISKWELRSLDGSSFTLFSLIGYIFLLYVFSMAIGLILAKIESLISFIYFEIKKTDVKTKYSDSVEITLHTAMIAAILAVGYNLVLFMFGISDVLIFQMLFR